MVLVLLAENSSQIEIHNYGKGMLVRVPETQPKFGGNYVDIMCFVLDNHVILEDALLSVVSTAGPV